MPIGDAAPELGLAGGAVVVILAALFLPRERQALCAVLALVVVAAVAALVLRLEVTAPAKLTFSGTFALDGVKTWVSLAILGTAGLVIVLSPRWFERDRRHGEWYAMLLFATLGSLLLAGAADAMELVVAALLASVTGSTLASYHRASRMSAEAGAKFYFLGALANPLLLLGVVLLFGLTGTTGYEGTAEALRAAPVDRLALGVAFALLWAGLAFELGAFPVHPWVPDVSQGAPVPAAAFLTVAPKIAALVALARVATLFPEDAVAWRDGVALLAALTMTIGNLAALWQDDVRRLLGWSSVSQAGYGLLAVVAVGRSDLALGSLIFFAVAYALANVAAFAVVASLRGRSELDAYRGLGRVRPGHAIALTVALLSLVGIPPLAGFTAKLTLFAASIEAGYAWLALLAVANTVVSLFYYLRVIAGMFLADARDSVVALLGWQATTVVAIAAAAVFFAGIFSEGFLSASLAFELLP